MPNNADEPVVLLSVPTEAEAAMIVAVLGDRGLFARVQGALTSGFRAEVPGEVQVLVRRGDLDHARAILADRSPAEDSA